MRTVSADEQRLRRRVAMNVRAARNRLGITQEQASTRAGFGDVRHWQKIEAGAVGITLATIARLVRGLGVEARDLFA